MFCFVCSIIRKSCVSTLLSLFTTSQGNVGEFLQASVSSPKACECSKSSLSVSPPPTLPCVITAFTLPGCVCYADTPGLLHINQSLLHDRDTKEVYFLCFAREEMGQERGESYVLSFARGGPHRRSCR